MILIVLERKRGISMKREEAKVGVGVGVEKGVVKKIKDVMKEAKEAMIDVETKFQIGIVIRVGIRKTRRKGVEVEVEIVVEKTERVETRGIEVVKEVVEDAKIIPLSKTMNRMPKMKIGQEKTTKSTTIIKEGENRIKVIKEAEKEMVTKEIQKRDLESLEVTGTEIETEVGEILAKRDGEVEIGINGTTKIVILKDVDHLTVGVDHTQIGAQISFRLEVDGIMVMRRMGQVRIGIIEAQVVQGDLHRHNKCFVMETEGMVLGNVL